jgi:lysophospholipase L1-like esterase
VKKLKHFIVRLASLLVILLVIPLAVSLGTASAASNYDGLLVQAPNLIVDNAPCGTTRDFGADWLEYATDQSKMIYPNDQIAETNRQLLASSLSNGGYRLVLDHPYDPGYVVVYSTDSNAKIVFATDPGQYHYYKMVSTNGTNNIGAVHVNTHAVRYGLSMCAEWGIGQGYTQIRDVFYGYNYPQGSPIFLNTFPVDYPVGYEGAVIESEDVPPAPTYVAMGDSYSSGEGNAPFMSETDVDGINECHRSNQAYPQLLQNDPDLETGHMQFVACSGATTSHVRNGGTYDNHYGEGPQMDALSGDIEVVTLTVGGNDVGFKDFVTGCAIALCTQGTSAYTDITDNINSTEFSDNLHSTYLEILTNALNADLYIINYPYVVKEKPNDGCDVFEPNLSSNDAAAEQVTSLLNAAIYDVYEDLKNDSYYAAYTDRLHFVDVNLQGSPFEGHDLCPDGTYPTYLAPYFYDHDAVLYFGDPRAFHPNVAGQAAYKQIIKEKILSTQ